MIVERKLSGDRAVDLLKQLGVGCSMLVIDIDLCHHAQGAIVGGSVEGLRPDAIAVPVFDDTVELCFLFHGNFFCHARSHGQDLIHLSHEEEEERCAVPAAAYVVVIIATVVPALAIENLLDAFFRNGAYGIARFTAAEPTHIDVSFVSHSQSCAQLTVELGSGSKSTADLLVDLCVGCAMFPID